MFRATSSVFYPKLTSKIPIRARSSLSPQLQKECTFMHSKEKSRKTVGDIGGEINGVGSQPFLWVTCGRAKNIEENEVKGYRNDDKHVGPSEDLAHPHEWMSEEVKKEIKECLTDDLKNDELSEDLQLSYGTEKTGSLEKNERWSNEMIEERMLLVDQIEKLTNFIENSEELREKSELLLRQQQQELEQGKREKDELEAKICGLHELQTSMQRKLDEHITENISLKELVKNTEGELFEERVKTRELKKEHSLEISKNVELEVALQTVMQELGCSHTQLRINNTCCVTWNKYSVNHERNRVENWKREKGQFEGKIKLLEKDKRRLYFNVNNLKEEVSNYQQITENLRENVEELKFRVFELEIQLSEEMLA